MIYSESERAQLAQFARAVWGNHDAVLRYSDGINFIDLEHYPALQEMFAVGHDKILIRQEYHIALQELESERYYEGAYVTGQPGIGKSLFLIYILVMHLGQKRAVVLQLPDDQQYAIFHTTVSFHSLNNPVPMGQFFPLWALSDSIKQVRIPSGIFVGVPYRIRVIQTTPPETSCWKRWSEETGAVGYVMDIWSEKEIGDLGKLLGLDAGKMTFLAKRWGCVPRSLLQFIHQKDDNSMIEAWYREHALQATLECGKAIPAIVRKAHVDDVPSKFFFCRPYIVDSEYGITRMHSRATVPTPTIRRLLGEALQFQDDETKSDFFNDLLQFSGACQAVHIIFENWFHSFFSAGKTIQCSWVQGRGDVSLTGPTTLVPSGVLDVLNEAQPPYFWIAPIDFPGVDSALILNTDIYVFQVNISLTHKSLMEGMMTLRNHLPTQLKKLPWRVVFIGNRSSMISAVAKEWVNQILSPIDGTSVPIAWSAVDPVDPSITYKEFREQVESDDATEVMFE